MLRLQPSIYKLVQNKLLQTAICLESHPAKIQSRCLSRMNLMGTYATPSKTCTSSMVLGTKKTKGKLDEEKTKGAH